MIPCNDCITLPVCIARFQNEYIVFQHPLSYEPYYLGINKLKKHCSMFRKYAYIINLYINGIHYKHNSQIKKFWRHYDPL